jgi:hypothetical protein
LLRLVVTGLLKMKFNQATLKYGGLAKEGTAPLVHLKSVYTKYTLFGFGSHKQKSIRGLEGEHLRGFVPILCLCIFSGPLGLFGSTVVHPRPPTLLSPQGQVQGLSVT